jgi:hypothetical protein
VGVGDDRLDVEHAAAGQGAQEVEPEGLRLGAADRHAQGLAAAISIHADCDSHRDGDDAPGLIAKMRLCLDFNIELIMIFVTINISMDPARLTPKLIRLLTGSAHATP